MIVKLKVVIDDGVICMVDLKQVFQSSSLLVSRGLNIIDRDWFYSDQSLSSITRATGATKAKAFEYERKGGKHVQPMEWQHDLVGNLSYQGERLFCGVTVTLWKRRGSSLLHHLSQH